MTTFSRAVLLTAALLIGAAPPAAQAARVCSGTISGSPLRPMATPPMVALDHPIEATSNPGLAEHFLTGLQSSGITVVPTGQGTTTLDLSFLLQGSHGGVKPGAYRDLNWMRSEQLDGKVKSELRGSRLDVTIYGRDAKSRSLVWTGAINCTIQTDDANALAEGLGAEVGKALGKSVPQRVI